MFRDINGDNPVIPSFLPSCKESAAYVFSWICLANWKNKNIYHENPEICKLETRLVQLFNNL